MVRFGPSILALTALFKVLRVIAAYLAAFMAAKIHQERYIDAVFMKKGDPPPLSGMLATFCLLHVMLSALAFAAIWALATFMGEGKGNTVRRAMLGALDMGCELVATLIMGMVLANVMTKKKYFSYRYEGLRAIRAYREILVVVAAVNGLTPYFLGAPDSWR